MKRLYSNTPGDEEATNKESDDTWEEDADDLYQWTQTLSIEDVT